MDHRTPSFIKSLDAVYLGRDSRTLHVRLLSEVSFLGNGTLCHVDCADKSTASEYFRGTIEGLRPKDHLKLVDVDVDPQGLLHPQILVLEPDYLMDCSNLAECFRPFGHHPLGYLLSRFGKTESTIPLLLGNLVNLMLDECVNRRHEAQYGQIVRLFFRQQSLQIAACAPMGDPDKARGFHQDARKHLAHIQHVLDETFQSPGYRLDASDAVLEPSYLCPVLGLQGRLDYMQRDASGFIEMKSGKADERSTPGKVLAMENHRVQMLLYQAMLEYSLGIPHDQVRPYLLYTRYPFLYPSRNSWNFLKEVLDLRNRIVSLEFRIQSERSQKNTDGILRQITPQVLNERKHTDVFTRRFLEAPSEDFSMKYRSLTSLDRSYFLELLHFISREQYLQKTSPEGMSRLWRQDRRSKIQEGEMITDLVLRENRASDTLSPCLLFSGPRLSQMDVVPNFRQGDAVILYQDEPPGSSADGCLIFKGTFEEVGDGSYKVSLRQSQRNQKVLPLGASFCVEHDSLDISFRNMYQGLGAFLDCAAERRDLILCRRRPSYDASLLDAAMAQEPGMDVFRRIALKAEAAKDLFLLIGPPGSGKTSRALRAMVGNFRSRGSDILLVAYTNRAVDEICRMLEGLDASMDYIRIGNEQAAGPQYRGRMLEQVLADCQNREQVLARLGSCHVFVATLSSLAARSALFQVKTFDVALVDESTQIMESLMLCLMCQSGSQPGRPAIGKFVLIGDHKQLPSVVLQDPADCDVRDEGLRKAGIRNFSESMFERLIRPLLEESPSDVMMARSPYFDMLLNQGRMHPDVALFSNRTFYFGMLRSLDLPHQKDTLSLCEALRSEPDGFLMERRTAFIPATPERSAQGGVPLKTCRDEARKAARLARLVYGQYRDREGGFHPERTLGIITPFRSQIALIRRELRILGIKEMESVTVDTVERFQGSERDVIIYSCCLNDPRQIANTRNLTEERGQLIDRKLNVAMTRARRQMFVIGAQEVLRTDPILSRLADVLGTVPIDSPEAQGDGQ